MPSSTKHSSHMLGGFCLQCTRTFGQTQSSAPPTKLQNLSGQSRLSCDCFQPWIVVLGSSRRIWHGSEAVFLSRFVKDGYPLVLPMGVSSLVLSARAGTSEKVTNADSTVFFFFLSTRRAARNKNPCNGQEGSCRFG